MVRERRDGHLHGAELLGVRGLQRGDRTLVHRALLFDERVERRLLALGRAAHRLRHRRVLRVEPRERVAVAPLELRVDVLARAAPLAARALRTPSQAGEPPRARWPVTLRALVVYSSEASSW